MLERYNSAIPNGAERIMAMAEKQAEHRRGLESETVRGNVSAQARGQHYALIVVLAGMICGTALVALGKQTEGLGTIFGPLALAAGIFLHLRRAQARERENKLSTLQASAKEQPS